MSGINRERSAQGGQGMEPRAARAIHAFYQKLATGQPSDAVTMAAPPPSFFLVGAPRCGTTMLSAALKAHPGISFSKPKETHFFLLAPPGLEGAALRQRYLALHHPSLGPEHLALGDGSVSYLFAPEAIRRALDFDPRARFIVSVRNPLELLPSYHARMLYTLEEDRIDFATAWELQAARAAGRHVPRRCRDPRVLQYGALGRLGEHVERLFAVAGRERCLVLVFDDLVADPAAGYRQVLAFLGLPDDGQERFRRKAESRGFKSPFLQQFVMNPPAWSLPLIRFANGDAIRRMKRLRRRIEKANRGPASRPEIPAGMRDTLRRTFADDVERLAGLIGRDLRHWLA